MMVRHKVLAKLCHATTVAAASSSIKALFTHLVDKLEELVAAVAKLLIMNTFAVEDCYSKLLTVVAAEFVMVNS